MKKAFIKKTLLSRVFSRIRGCLQFLLIMLSEHNLRELIKFYLFLKNQKTFCDDFREIEVNSLKFA